VNEDELRAREQQSAGEGVAIPWCHDSRTLFSSNSLPSILLSKHGYTTDNPTRIQRNGPSGSDYLPWIRFESGHLCKSPFHRKPCPIQFVTLGDGSRRITRRSSPGSTPALTRSPTPGIPRERRTATRSPTDFADSSRKPEYSRPCLGSRRRGRGYWLRPPGESRGGTALRRRDELRPRPPSDDRSRAARDPIRRVRGGSRFRSGPLVGLSSTGRDATRGLARVIVS